MVAREMPVMLDFEIVSSMEIEVEVHQYLGRFHPPRCPQVNELMVKCVCGELLIKSRDLFDHWDVGHFDTLLYATRSTVNTLEKSAEIEVSD